MRRFRIFFTARKLGALGTYSPECATVESSDRETAIGTLYNAWDLYMYPTRVIDITPPSRSHRRETFCVTLLTHAPSKGTPFSRYYHSERAATDAIRTARHQRRILPTAVTEISRVR